MLLPTAKLRWNLVVIALLLGGALGVPPAGEADVSEVDIARRLCAQLNLNLPALAAVKAHASAGRHIEALAAWRDGAVDRLRKATLGEFTLHGYRRHPRQTSIADMLLGRKPSSKDGTDFLDLYDISGPVEPRRPINWLTRVSDPVTLEKAQFGNFFFTISLAERYWQDGDETFLRKWFAITSDFARTHKRAVDGMSKNQLENIQASWQMNHGSCLTQSARMETILKCLGVLAKSLPPTGGAKPARDEPAWNQVLDPVMTTTTAHATIPAAALAEVVLSLVLDHPEPQLTFYAKSGVTPNQRRHGLISLLLVARQFSEFTVAATIEAQAAAAFEAWMNETLQVDGGMLEASFNYNLSDARSLEEFSRSLDSDPPAWADLLHQRVAGFHLMTAALATPTGEPPSVGNQGTTRPPALWRDTAARSAWNRSPNRIAPPAKAAFTAAAFPFSGYYMQRRDWEWDSPYLFFSNSRPATGHFALDANAIEVHAYGRPLLVRAGQPPYTVAFVDASQRKDYAQLDDYFGEAGPFKTNTVQVDGRGQSRADAWATVCPPTPIAARWLASERFAFVEGTYDQGYGDCNVYFVKKPQIDRSVSHHRQVVFVRSANCWLVIDRLRATDERTHTFTQTWHLPPFITGKDAVSGFTAEQVVIDPTANLMHTDDPIGPNIWVQHLGGDARTYEKFHGHKNPFRGWYARHIGDAVPAPEVRISWSGARTSVLVTAIVPSRDQQHPYTLIPPVPATANAKAEQSTGGDLRLNDGTVINVRAALDKPAMLTAGPISGTGELLVTVTHGGSTSGIALGCASLSHGKKSRAATHRDGEWELRGGMPEVVAPITLPSGFSWVDDSTGLRPAYTPAVVVAPRRQ